jgi:hypothetical protein
MEQERTYKLQLWMTDSDEAVYLLGMDPEDMRYALEIDTGYVLQVN